MKGTRYFLFIAISCLGLLSYSKPGRMRAGWAYFASWPQLAKDFAQLSQTKLTRPV